MFFHILAIRNEVTWVFCNVVFAQVPLVGVDSINVANGSADDDSVLSIVVFGASNEHLQMLDGLLGQLLKMKWENGARRKFHWFLARFICFQAAASVVYITRFELIQPNFGLSYPSSSLVSI